MSVSNWGAMSWHHYTTFPRYDLEKLTRAKPNCRKYSYAELINNAIDAFRDKGYVTIGVQNGVGVAVTVDSNLDVYVGVTAGRIGVSGVVGTAPEGTTATQFLSEWGVTAITTPIALGVAGNDSGLASAYGTPGFSVGYNVNVSQTWRDGHHIADVLNGAKTYFDSAYGINQTYQ